jgi:hypothetical protein
MLADELDAVLQGFNENLESVSQLSNFDRTVIDFTLARLETLQDRLSSLSENPRHHVSSIQGQLRRIRKHESLTQQYSEIFNQCVVLQVSYFGSTAGSLIRTYLPFALTKGEGDLMRQEMKVSIQELYSLGELESVAELIFRKQDISFQDMKSLKRAFAELLEVEVPRGEHTNNIVCGQACRHVIVHKGAQADGRCLAQLRDAMPRNLKSELKVGDVIRFEPSELECLADSMRVYFQRVADLLIQKYR